MNEPPNEKDCKHFIPLPFPAAPYGRCAKKMGNGYDGRVHGSYSVTNAKGVVKHCFEPKEQVAKKGAEQMTEKFTAAAGETAAMTAAYLAKHKCRECAAYWRDGIKEYCLAKPRNRAVAFQLYPDSTACNKFRNKEQSK